MNFKKSQPVRIVIADDHPIFRDGCAGFWKLNRI
jgi:DNA-binding NarL/FixJ family response regulator